MSVVFGAIAPHGFPLIPVVSDDADGGLQTRAAMTELGQRFDAAQADTIVLAGPHGIRVDGAFCICQVARAAGALPWRDKTVEMNVPYDLEFATRLGEACRAADVPVAMAGYAGNRPDQSAVPMDWGAMVPLWFMGHGRNLPGKGNVLADAPDGPEGPPVVLITPSRSLPRQEMVRFGEVVANTAAESGRRVAFIASCDWSHTHSADGPYGAHPAAKAVDAAVIQAIERNDLIGLIDLPEDDVRNAAIDGLWQALMLAGVQRVVPMTPDLLSYEAPRYYGMIVAAFSPS